MNHEELAIYIGNQIKKFREKRGLTQQGLADKLNVSRQAVSRYEKGLRKANQDTLFELSRILKCSIDDFFPKNDVDEKPQTLAAHLEGELKQEDIDYIMSLVERFKNEDK
ncbi:helix-turn-helix transcriptional regulator [Staphylococcus delphini]|uniref:helix-turn-helix transcriptional regulator n=1 Tax=Staphylococcus delphini TaxID=53344 RepID=UPI0023B27761|nr:helix-turn-helix transcriptional regulator [Staphylococcus delphini]MDE9798931.1 helix-turn-helix transcriptional regulator [Staphylococcus delphini]MDE9806096.1 helix-turn-helix transcriptional regulator [Staphylococcus delphini]